MSYFFMTNVKLYRKNDYKMYKKGSSIICVQWLSSKKIKLFPEWFLLGGLE